MKGQLISDWQTTRWRSKHWVLGFIKVNMSVRFYGRLRRNEGLFCEVELDK